MHDADRGAGPSPVRSGTASAGRSPNGVLVLGMHRSGTSAVAGLLCGLGCWAGEEGDLLEPAEANRDGFFERKHTAEVLDDILRELGGSWWQPPFERLNPVDLVEARPRIRRLIDQVYLEAPAGSTPLIKDPRLCLFGSELTSLFRPGGIVVVCIRHPVAVARSLQEAHKLPMRLGLALWEAYNTSLCSGLAGQPVHVVNTSTDVSDSSAMERFVRSLHLHHTEPEQVTAIAAERIRPRHVRQWVTPQDEQEWLTAAQMSLWQALAEAARSVQPNCLDAAALSASARDVFKLHHDQSALAQEREVLAVQTEAATQESARLVSELAVAIASAAQFERLEEELRTVRADAAQQVAMYEEETLRARQASTDEVARLEAERERFEAELDAANIALLAEARHGHEACERELRLSSVLEQVQEALAAQTAELWTARQAQAVLGLKIAEFQAAFTDQPEAWRGAIADLSASLTSTGAAVTAERSTGPARALIEAIQAERDEWRSRIESAESEASEARRQRDHALQCLADVTGSRSWRIGLRVTWIVRRFRRRPTTTARELAALDDA